MPEGTTTQAIAHALLANWPFVRCFVCLSTHVGVPEKDAREAAQLLVVRDGFSTARRVCQICHRADDVLVCVNKERRAPKTRTPLT
jgi:hypothetical protein